MPIGVPGFFFTLAGPPPFISRAPQDFCGLPLVAALRRPEKHPRLSATELNYIKEGQPPVEQQHVTVPWLKLLRYRAVWAYLLACILAVQPGAFISSSCRIF